MLYPCYTLKVTKLTPEACRAGRALLGWGVRDLAAEAGISPATVNGIEHGRTPWPTSAEKIVAAFARHGVEITNGEGTGARLVASPPSAKKAPKGGSSKAATRKKLTPKRT
jgi:transcriptional regulator with XRE-family HTH domain